MASRVSVAETTGLLEAGRLGDIATIQDQLLAISRRLNIPMANVLYVQCKDDSGLNIVHYAAETGKTNVLDWLFEYRPIQATPATRDLLLQQKSVDGGDPMMIAAKHGQIAFFRALQRRGCSLATRSHNGTTPLLMAAINKKTDMAKVIFVQLSFANLTELQHAGNDGGITPLHAAAYRGDLELASFLINNGADVNAVTMGGQTPLHSAADVNDREIAVALLDAGASLWHQDADGFSPIGVAVAEVVKRGFGPIRLGGALTEFWMRVGSGQSH